MSEIAPRSVFHPRPTPQGWDVVCDRDGLGYQPPGLYQTEQAARAEAERLDVLYAS